MLSAEPGRKAPYVADLRWRMIWQRIGMELPYRTISANLNVALGTVHHINRRFVEIGDVHPKVAPQRTCLRTLSHSDELYILGLIIDSPSRYLSEVCHAVEDVQYVLSYPKWLGPTPFHIRKIFRYVKYGSHMGPTTSTQLTTHPNDTFIHLPCSIQCAKHESTAIAANLYITQCAVVR